MLRLLRVVVKSRTLSTSALPSDCFALLGQQA